MASFAPTTRSANSSNGHIATMSSELFDNAAQVAAGGAGVGGGFVFVRWLLNWLTGRHDRREDRLDRRWSEFQEAQDKRIKEQDARLHKQGERIDALEEDVERCHSEKRELAARLSKVEGFATGRGEAAQLGQIERSLDNQIARQRSASAD